MAIDDKFDAKPEILHEEGPFLGHTTIIYRDAAGVHYRSEPTGTWIAYAKEKPHTYDRLLDEENAQKLLDHLSRWRSA